MCNCKSLRLHLHLHLHLQKWQKQENWSEWFHAFLSMFKCSFHWIKKMFDVLELSKTSDTLKAISKREGQIGPPQEPKKTTTHQNKTEKYQKPSQTLCVFLCGCVAEVAFARLSCIRFMRTEFGTPLAKTSKAQWKYLQREEIVWQVKMPKNPTEMTRQ